GDRAASYRQAAPVGDTAAGATGAHGPAVPAVAVSCRPGHVAMDRAIDQGEGARVGDATARTANSPVPAVIIPIERRSHQPQRAGIEDASAASRVGAAAARVPRPTGAAPAAGIVRE